MATDITAPSTTFDPTSPRVQALLRKLNNPWLMRFFYLTRLPSVFFWGIRIRHITPQACQIVLPYSWFTKNPFKSIYFSAQAGAAELSSGMLCNLAIQGRGRISMLVVAQEASFIKKAASRTVFHCTDGQKILDAVQKAIDTGEGVQVKVHSEGRDKEGDVVSRFSFTWSFKVKK